MSKTRFETSSSDAIQFSHLGDEHIYPTAAWSSSVLLTVTGQRTAACRYAASNVQELLVALTRYRVWGETSWLMRDLAFSLDLALAMVRGAANVHNDDGFKSAITPKILHMETENIMAGPQREMGSY